MRFSALWLMLFGTSCAGADSSTSDPQSTIASPELWRRPPQFVGREGRRIAYAEYGDENGAPVVFLHGGPGSRIEGALFDVAARRAGVRLIAPDRPGLGASDMADEVTLRSVANDMAHLADALDLDRPVIAGWSGGGVPAVACGVLRPDRFSAVISLAGYTRLDREELREQIPEPDRSAVAILDRNPRRFRRFFKLVRFAALRMPRTYWRTLINDVPEADREALELPGMRALFIEDQQESLRQGVDGIVADAKLSYTDWGFDPRAATLPVHVFHGTEDSRVPVDFAHDLVTRFEHGELHIIEGAGHMFPVTHADEIMDVARALWAEG